MPAIYGTRTTTRMEIILDTSISIRNLNSITQSRSYFKFIIITKIVRLQAEYLLDIQLVASYTISKNIEAEYNLTSSLLGDAGGE